MLDPAIFRDYPDLKVGDMVRYEMKAARNCGGVGWIRLIWMGIEEMCTIQSQGKQITVCRSLGDKLELL